MRAPTLFPFKWTESYFDADSLICITFIKSYFIGLQPIKTRRVRLVDGLVFETNILRVSPVKSYFEIQCLVMKYCLSITLQLSIVNGMTRMSKRATFHVEAVLTTVLTTGEILTGPRSACHSAFMNIVVYEH